MFRLGAVGGTSPVARRNTSSRAANSCRRKTRGPSFARRWVTPNNARKASRKLPAGAAAEVTAGPPGAVVLGPPPPRQSCSSATPELLQSYCRATALGWGSFREYICVPTSALVAIGNQRLNG